MEEYANPMKKFRIGSLFSGIGGIELGIQNAIDAEVVWQVEQDPFCRKVLEKHWPGARRYGDINTVRAGELAEVDLVCGGFPCTDISLANTNGKGLEGAKSGLWGEFRRILCELRPSFAVVENVRGFRTRGLSKVLGDLAHLGYDAKWDCISAASLGGWHLRQRLFILAWHPANLDSARREKQWGPITGATEHPSIELLNWGGCEPELGRMVHGVPNRIHRNRALGNSVVPQSTYIVGENILQLAKKGR